MLHIHMPFHTVSALRVPTVCVRVSLRCPPVQTFEFRTKCSAGSGPALNLKDLHTEAFAGQAIARSVYQRNNVYACLVCEVGQVTNATAQSSWSSTTVRTLSIAVTVTLSVGGQSMHLYPSSLHIIHTSRVAPVQAKRGVWQPSTRILSLLGITYGSSNYNCCRSSCNDSHSLSVYRHLEVVNDAHHC